MDGLKPVSFWDGLLSGAKMLVSGSVSNFESSPQPPSWASDEYAYEAIATVCPSLTDVCDQVLLENTRSHFNIDDRDSCLTGAIKAKATAPWTPPDAISPQLYAEVMFESIRAFEVEDVHLVPIPMSQVYYPLNTFAGHPWYCTKEEAFPRAIYKARNTVSYHR